MQFPHYIGEIGFVIDFFGKLLVSYTAISVHHRFWKEHKVDEVVFREMRHERNLGLFGVTLMLIGFFLEAGSRWY